MKKSLCATTYSRQIANIQAQADTLMALLQAIETPTVSDVSRTIELQRQLADMLTYVETKMTGAA